MHIHELHFKTMLSCNSSFVLLIETVTLSLTHDDISTRAGIFTDAELNRLRKAYSDRRKTLRVGRVRIVGLPHSWGQFKALFRKRADSTRRNTNQLVVQLLPPLIFTLLALTAFELAPGPRDLPARSMSNLASSYGDNTVYVNASDSSSSLANVTTVLAAQIKAQSGSQAVGDLGR